MKENGYIIILSLKLMGGNEMFQLKINEDIMLRMLSARDAKQLFEITDRSRSHLKKWLPWLNDTVSEADSLSFIKNSFIPYQNRKGLTAGVFYRKKLVGVVGYNSIDLKNRIGTVGYWLDIHQTGKGIMSHSVKALVNYGFTELNLNRIEIRCAVGNIASRAIPERLEFVQEGILREVEWLYHHFVDHVIYSMLQKDWKSTHYPQSN